MSIRNKQTILIYSNDPITISTLAPALNRWYHVEVAEMNPSLAKHIALEDAPDVIVLDVMVDQSEELFESFHPFMRIGTSIAAMLDQNDPDFNYNERYLLEHGCSHVFRKPFEVPTVMAYLRNILLGKIKVDMLELIAVSDAMTGIFNKRGLEEEADALHKRGEAFSIVFCDIDFFKKINDIKGHLFGDDCIKKISSTLDLMVHRNGGVFGRWGGEEFMAIFPNIRSEVAQSIAEIMRCAVEDMKIEHPNSTASRYVTISLGVATCDPSKESFKNASDEADKALYQSKHNGRNRVSAT